MDDLSPIDGDPILPMCVDELRFQTGGRGLLDVKWLEIGDGGPTILLGPNGAGKSLLLRMLHGLMQPTSGAVRFAGRDMNDQVRRRQALVFQKPVLLRRSVGANVAYALAVRGVPRRRRADRVMHFLEIGGLGDRARQPARSLSGGEQQRLALVRALALRPRVLFLDEPTASLDPGATKAIEEIVLSAAAGGTKIVLVTHNLGQARRLAEDVVFLYRGQVAEHSEAAKFFDKPASQVAADFMAGRLVV